MSSDNTTMNMSQSPLGTLYKLPLEIREMIYGHLTPPSRLPTVLRSRHLGVSSVSHRPPPLDALLVCRQLCAEALTVYYRKCVFKLDGLLDPANIWPLWQVEEVLGGSELGHATLANMRKVELNLFWHRLPDGGIETSSENDIYGKLCLSESDKRVERLGRAVQVLRRAKQLKSVILTWKEIPLRAGDETQADWPRKETVLQSLGALRGSQIVEGDIIASDHVEISILSLLKELNRTTSKTKHHNRVGSRAYLELVESAEGTPGVSNNLVNKRQSYFG